MPATEERQVALRQALLRQDAVASEALVRELGVASAPVLAQLENHVNTDVRRSVVEVAGLAPGVENCRLLVRRAADPDDEVRGLATLQLRACKHREILPELLHALESPDAPDAKGALALQVGSVGGGPEIPRLAALRRRTTDPELRDDLGLALAKLGDPSARGELVARLTTGNATTRVAALKDTLYVGDATLVGAFGPALSDPTDVIALSFPEDPPMEYARVCDVAAFTMVQLGVGLGFPLESLSRLDQPQLDQARARAHTAGSR